MAFAELTGWDLRSDKTRGFAARRPAVGFGLLSYCVSGELECKQVLSERMTALWARRPTCADTEAPHEQGPPAGIGELAVLRWLHQGHVLTYLMVLRLLAGISISILLRIGLYQGL